MWFGDIPVATLRPDGSGGVEVFYVHTDHLSTPRRISRPSDNVIVWRWDSDAFGTTAANQDPDGDGQTFAYGLRFPGQYADGETGLNYNYFRDYDSVTGRYIQSDPIGLSGGINTYGYVGGNPLSFADPFGLQAAPQPAPGFPPGLQPEPGMRPFPGMPPANAPRISPALGPLAEACLANPVLCVAAACLLPDSTSACDTTIPNPESNCPDDRDRCAKAIAQAQRIYNELTTRSIPQYMYAGTQGRADAGHHRAITQGQSALRNAIQQVRLYCRSLPADLAKWENLAGQSFPVRH